MKPNNISHAAEEDTPSGVHVPNNWTGLFVWAIGRFGVGVLFAGVFGWWLMTVYSDLRRDADRVLTAFQQQAVSNAMTVTALQELTTAVKTLTTLQIRVEKNERDILELRRRKPNVPDSP